MHVIYVPGCIDINAHTHSLSHLHILEHTHTHTHILKTLGMFMINKNTDAKMLILAHGISCTSKHVGLHAPPGDVCAS
jgi:hypothetical protein